MINGQVQAVNLVENGTDEFSDASAPGSTLWCIFAANVCDLWFKRALLDAVACRHMITPMTSPGSTENNNTLFTGDIRGERVAGLGGGGGDPGSCVLEVVCIQVTT
jgi:hypothetical protein